MPALALFGAAGAIGQSIATAFEATQTLLGVISESLQAGEPPRSAALIDKIFAAAGRPSKFLVANKLRLRALGLFNPLLHEMVEMHYLLTNRPPQEEADSYLKMMAVDGFGEGAIVSRRFQPNWKHKWHGNWGMITRVIGFVPHAPTDPWNPYFVKWFSKDGIQAPDEEFCWAEDLVIIHAALDKITLEQILEEQDVDLGST